MEYIHDMRPNSRLLPASVEDRAKVRMVTEIVASGIQPHQVTKITNDHETKSTQSRHFQNADQSTDSIIFLQNAARNFEDQVEREAWSKGWITKGFRALEKV